MSYWNIRIKLSSVAILAAVSALITFGFSAKSAQAETDILMNAQYPQHHPLYKGVINKLKAGMAKVTQGRVKARPSDASLGPSRKQWSMVTSGVADVTVMFTAYERKRLSIYEFSRLPFTTKGAESSSVAAWKTHNKFFKKIDPFKGVHLLGFVTLTGTQMYMRDKPFNSLADLKGIKVRTGPGAQAKLMKKLGGVPVVGFGKDFFPYMSKGIVDGMIANMSSINTYKISKWVGYETTLPGKFGNALFVVISNKKKWDGISAADRSAIMANVGGINLSRSGGQAYDAQDNAAIKKFAGKIKTQQASAALIAQIKKAAAPFEAGWIKKANARGVDGAAALKYFRAEQGLPN